MAVPKVSSTSRLKALVLTLKTLTVDPEEGGESRLNQKMECSESHHL
jgi:hypothetical protein